MHVGSRHALFPDEFYSHLEGNYLGLNDGQKTLLKYWEDFVKKCGELNVDTVILDGDIIHSTNYKEFVEWIRRTFTFVLHTGQARISRSSLSINAPPP